MKSRKPIVAANWKMNMHPSEADAFLGDFVSSVGSEFAIDVVVCPPYVSLPKAAEHLADNAAIGLGGQNVSEQESGAYTGEVNIAMLKEVSVEYVILGHSERRSLYGETDEIINAKLNAVLAAGLKPIVCIGETIEEREAGKIEEVLTTQLTGSLKGLTAETAEDLVLAYEPVWAIGTGLTATPEQAQEAHAFVRKTLAGIIGEDAAAKVRIQYGGSVKPGNMGDLIALEDVDGALVGGASLDSISFQKLIDACQPTASP